jgi:hypothetical protein
MRDITGQLRDAVLSRLHALPDGSAEQRLQAIVGGNFDETQISSAAMKAWLAFWASSMHQPMLYRLQQVSSRRLLSNLVYEFRRELPREQAQEAGYGLAALIDGLWLRAALSGKPLDKTWRSRSPATLSASIYRPNNRGEFMSRMAEQQLYINGGYTSATSGRTFETINPANGEVLATVQAAGREDVDRAVKAQNAGKNLGGDDRHGTLAHSASRRRYPARAQRRAGEAGNPRHR